MDLTVYEVTGGSERRFTDAGYGIKDGILTVIQHNVEPRYVIYAPGAWSRVETNAEPPWLRKKRTGPPIPPGK